MIIIVILCSLIYFKEFQIKINVLFCLNEVHLFQYVEYLVSLSILLIIVFLNIN